ncbi:phosphotransferase family protein [Nocardioides sp. YIM 152315]|uniref:phosphotransferase family protein n=1 Tax=Nocardioides sp. YIM 152315 TaxID=3031760 RepID=UPI0023DB39B1|nr:phosphotransferase family protein [Nocardioides sp. YIM 152315]MDF1606506.1 phosphotransferase family protein [Nocardioides sp. YIM 152315]
MSGATHLTSEDLAAVATAMRDAGREVGALTATMLTAGRSNLTYVIGDGASRWILRTPPRAGRTPSAHDVAREFRVMSALAADVPVPSPVVLVEDEAVIGVPFTVVDFVSGVTVQHQEQLDRLDDGELADVVAALVGTLADLHRVDPGAVGLDDFGRPDAYAQRQVRRWTRQWQAVGVDGLDPLATELAGRLAASVPDQRRTSVVHGDYRIDNTILDGRDRLERVGAVVDWELSTLGDPVADVAVMCAYRHPTFDLIVGAPSAWTSHRLPTVEGLAQTYERASGETLADWDFHLALAYFKVAVIAAGIAHRAREGAASGAGFATAGDAVETYLGLGLEALGVRV